MENRIKPAGNEENLTGATFTFFFPDFGFGAGSDLAAGFVSVVALVSADLASAAGLASPRSFRRRLHFSAGLGIASCARRTGIRLGGVLVRIAPVIGDVKSAAFEDQAGARAD